MKRALLILFLSSCTNGDDEPSNFAACEDTADAVVALYARCDLSTDAAMVRADFFEGVGIASCADVKAIRDVDALYQECLPDMTTAACDPFVLPEACMSQLLR